MQVKVQTVSELTINQLSDDQYLAEKAAGRINAGEVYACTPSPVKWEDIQGKPNVSGGGDVDYQELARRIPTWQWKVTMPKTVNQTVTATVGGQTYTSDYYAQQGSQIAFSVTPDPGYIAGIVSPKSATLTGDLTVIVSVATTGSETIEAGTKTFGVNGDTLIVPPKVQVLKWAWDGKDIYAKVNPGQQFYAHLINYGEEYQLNYILTIKSDGVTQADVSDPFDKPGYSDAPLTASWSSEINKHAVDYDWTK